ncbi:hypothetical protein [Phocaeicola sp.]
MEAKDRLMQYLDYKGISPTKAETMLGWGKGAFIKAKSISVDKAGEFLLLFKDLSAEWLLRGEGEMLRSNDSTSGDGTSEKEIILYVDENGFLRVKKWQLMI